MHAGRARVDAELVLDRHGIHVVAFARRAVGIQLELRHEEQRDALRALRRARQARQHEVHDVLRHVVVAPRDEDLAAGDQVAGRLAARRAWSAPKDPSPPAARSGTSCRSIHRRSASRGTAASARPSRDGRSPGSRPATAPGTSAKATLAPAHISSQAIEMVFGRPCPPNSGFDAMPGQPPSQNLRIGRGELRPAPAPRGRRPARPCDHRSGWSAQAPPLAKRAGFLEHGLRPCPRSTPRISRQRDNVLEIDEVLDRELHLLQGGLVVGHVPLRPSFVLCNNPFCLLAPRVPMRRSASAGRVQSRPRSRGTP